MNLRINFSILPKRLKSNISNILELSELIFFKEFFYYTLRKSSVSRDFGFVLFSVQVIASLRLNYPMCAILQTWMK
jgi:hypothetical protein